MPRFHRGTGVSPVKDWEVCSVAVSSEEAVYRGGIHRRDVAWSPRTQVRSSFLTGGTPVPRGATFLCGPRPCNLLKSAGNRQEGLKRRTRAAPNAARPRPK